MTPLRTLTISAGAAMAVACLALPATAFASSPADVGNISVASGNTISVPVSIPVDVCGLAVAILGGADAGCQGGATVLSVSTGGSSGGGSGSKAGNVSVGSGNKVSVPVSVPVNICGVSVALLGAAKSGCAGGGTVVVHPVNPPPTNPPPVNPPPGGGTGNPPGGGHHPPQHHKHHKHHKAGYPATAPAPYGQPPTQTTSLVAGVLPTTGANLLGLLAGAFAAIGAGVAAALSPRLRLRRR